MNKKEKIDYEELNNVINSSKRMLNLAYVVLIVSIIIAGLFLAKYLKVLSFIGGILKVISPLFFGFIIAWLFNPLVKKLKRKGLSKIASGLIVYLAFILCLILFIRVFIPVLYSQINDLISSLPSIFSEIEKFATNFLKNFELDAFNLESIEENMVLTLENGLFNIMNNLPNFIINLIGKLFSGIGVVLLSLIIGLYMLFDFDSIAIHLIKIIPKKYRKEISALLDKIGEEVRKTVNGTLLVALMVFVSDSIGFSIIGLKAPVLFGLFCGLTDLIPYIGPYLGGIAAVIVGFSQSSVIGISCLIIVVIVQLVESYILQPVVMSKAMQLHPVTIIVGLLIFGYFFGIIGMVLATPCLALLKVVLYFVKGKLNLFKE